MTSPAPGLRRYFDAVGSRALLTPYLEAAIAARKKDAWPKEFPVGVSNRDGVWDGYFHPSRHASMPALKMYYEFLHTEVGAVSGQPETSEQVLNLMMGSAYHATFQSLLIELGLTTKEEVEVPFRSEARRCSGTCDVRRVFLPSGESPMVEVKSAAWIPKEPFPEHVRQFQPYLDLAGADGPVERGCIVYIEKGSGHRLKEFVVDRDPAILSDIYRTWERVLEAVELEDPSRLPNCEGCEYGNKVHLECFARDVCRIGAPPKVAVGYR